MIYPDGGGVPPSPQQQVTKETEELSGLSVDYYQCEIRFPTTPSRESYIAECNDIIETLEMTPAEANIFKEIWRTAAARSLGKKKTGHSILYAYEKIYFFAKRQYELFKLKANIK